MNQPLTDEDSPNQLAFDSLHVGAGVSDLLPESNTAKPRVVLAEWANKSDEWVRYVVGEVLSSGTALPAEKLEYAHQLFRQEKALDPRKLPRVGTLAVGASTEEKERPLTITRVSEVAGVNALCPGGLIEPHEGLTILFGENGTGKTGYSRVLKALAASRSADDILGDIRADHATPPSAKIGYKIGGDPAEYAWRGERGHAPFTRMSIFDSPAVHFHVDDELEYTYVPAVLALYTHVLNAVKAVQGRVAETIEHLTRREAPLLERFPKECSVYAQIETLGAATDLARLRGLADDDPAIATRIEILRQTVASLEANTTSVQVSAAQRHVRVLTEADQVAGVFLAFDIKRYTSALTRAKELRQDHVQFREQFFKAADLPMAPDPTWEAFVRSGEEYRSHLADCQAYDAGRCLYCRQELDAPARNLLRKYAEYLADKIGRDIADATEDLKRSTGPLLQATLKETQVFLSEVHELTDSPAFIGVLEELVGDVESLQSSIQSGIALPPQATDFADLRTRLGAALSGATQELGELQSRAANRLESLTRLRQELAELVAAGELARSWSEIERRVAMAKEADRLKHLAHTIPNLLRHVTELAKAASDELINQSFDQLFAEECSALRAPDLRLEFVGRQGRAHRRKVLQGKHKPSKVFSEGEQKVLALADFLAEARLAGITAPVVFDDPVSSLDHRRIGEVANRIVRLSETTQVIVFTHDIFFATTLLSLCEKSKRCSYFQITDDGGIGRIARATGPRWDTLKYIKAQVNKTIQAAKTQDGEGRAALVRTGYDWLRSWCEVFTEQELLQGVTQRYQPQVRMTVLPAIKTDALPSAISTVVQIFEEACRHIDGHSQPLASLGVTPTLDGLEAHWRELQQCQADYGAA